MDVVSIVAVVVVVGGGVACCCCCYIWNSILMVFCVTFF
jgi:hypothetical protein